MLSLYLHKLLNADKISVTIEEDPRNEISKHVKTYV